MGSIVILQSIQIDTVNFELCILAHENPPPYLAFPSVVSDLRCLTKKSPLLHATVYELEQITVVSHLVIANVRCARFVEELLGAGNLRLLYPAQLK